MRLMLGQTLLAPRVARSDALNNYTVEVLARAGQQAGDFTPQVGFAVGQLNDRGQLALITNLNGNWAVIQYSDRKFIPVAVAQGPAPGGKTWPKNIGFYTPSMNQAGNIAFVPARSGAPLGVYLWDSKTQTVTPVATPGTPATNNQVFLGGGDHGGAVINNRDEIAFVGFVRNRDDGNRIRGGIFVRRGDGQMQGVAVPGDPLPGRAG